MVRVLAVLLKSGLIIFSNSSQNPWIQGVYK